MNTTLQTAAFCEAHKFTKGQAISFEIINLVNNGTNIREALEQVCGPVAAAETPDWATDAELLQAVQDTFFEGMSEETLELIFN